MTKHNGVTLEVEDIELEEAVVEVDPVQEFAAEVEAALDAERRKYISDLDAILADLVIPPAMGGNRLRPTIDGIIRQLDAAGVLKPIWTPGAKKILMKYSRASTASPLSFTVAEMAKHLVSRLALLALERSDSDKREPGEAAAHAKAQDKLSEFLDDHGEKSRIMAELKDKEAKLRREAGNADTKLRQTRKLMLLKAEVVDETINMLRPPPTTGALPVVRRTDETDDTTAIATKAARDKADASTRWRRSSHRRSAR